MLDLRRLRLLRELRDRGTIAAVADALQFTPSAVSQQLAILERESGVRLLERAGRGVRLTDAALVLADHAEALLERAAVAEAELAAAAGTVAGRPPIAGLGWDEMTRRTCRELGGFEPDVRHRTNDAGISLEIIAQGLAVGMLPDLALPPRLPRIELRDIADAQLSRAIFAATRATDAARPSTQAVLAAVR